MPTQHTRPSKTGTTPQRGNAFDPNWMKAQRQGLLDTPWCIANAADINLAAGAPGALASFTWNGIAAPDTIYDRFNMIGPNNTTDIRIPWDGIYDIMGSCAFINTNAVFEFSSVLLYAPTSDSGFGAPVFANYLSIPGSFERNYLQVGLAAPTIAPRCPILHAGMPFFANDLIRYQGQVSSASARQTRFEYFMVRWVGPIPNNMATIMPNHV